MNKVNLLSGASLPSMVPARQPGDRYVPRSYGAGPGWGVWDAKEQRFVEDAELEGIDPEAIRYANVRDDA